MTGLSGLSGWVFIAVGFVVIAVSIFFYNTLKIFIAIGGFMVIYGLGKLSYDKFKAKLFPPEKEEGPIDISKTPNPYLQAQKQTQQQAPTTQQILMQHRKPAPNNVLHHKYTIARRSPAPQHPLQKQVMSSGQVQLQSPLQGSVQRSHHYCHLCGNPLHRGDRFCSSCGTRIGG